jgi:hypothetical protein
MSLTTILTQFALTVGASLAERVASALSARIKQEPKPEANPVDIAIATKSAVSADREGKIASEQAKAVYECGSCFKPAAMVDDAGRCPPCGERYERLREPLAVASEPGKAPVFKVDDRVKVKWSWMDSSWNGVVLAEESGNYKVQPDNNCAPWSCRPHEMTLLSSSRRLGDYGPGGE